MIAAFLAFNGEEMIPHCRITLSDSLPRGLYCETTEPLARGVIVAECLPAELTAFGMERGYLQNCFILKQVAGMPGDTIELAEDYVAVNDNLVLNSATLREDTKGRKIPTIERGTFVLKAGEIFLLATNSERSWDGRYTGPAKMSDVRATLKPVFTESGSGL
jgi:conjugative transfer signal peptidase TraF